MINILKQKQLIDIKPKIYHQQDHIFRNDENNVDVDKEMVDMLKTLFHTILCRSNTKINLNASNGY